MIKVLFCASEVAPFAKTGGLADVAGSLPLELGLLGAKILILLPKYRGISSTRKKISENVEVRFIENEEYFNRASLYGEDRGDYPDNLKRFSFFCDASLDLAEKIGFRPDIVHTHDWQTALIPVFLKTKRAPSGFFKRSRSVLTIHNIAYQGHFPAREFGELGLDKDLFSIDGFEFYGKINLLKAGILYADALNTVSPTYAKEIQTKDYGFGLEGVVKTRRWVLKGILNGIDTDVWNPARDRNIPKKYSAADLAGKGFCKARLQKFCGFEVNSEIPVFALVARLAEQKGLDLLSEICNTFLAEKAQLVLLGDGDRSYETTFRNVRNRHPKNSAVFFEFQAALAHQIYAGADFFLMPSYFEPCGLGQMIGMRYGTVPIVRRTGGLADTVTDADSPGGNGIVFREPDPDKLLEAIRRALKVYRDKKKLGAVRKRAMKKDFSWRKSAKAYLQMYKETLG